MSDLRRFSSTPLESMPVWLSTIMQVVPSTHFVSFERSCLRDGRRNRVLVGWRYRKLIGRWRRRVNPLRIGPILLRHYNALESRAGLFIAAQRSC
jgi:hypothetical protein